MQWCVKYHVILDSIITALDCNIDCLVIFSHKGEFHLSESFGATDWVKFRLSLCDAKLVNYWLVIL